MIRYIVAGAIIGTLVAQAVYAFDCRDRSVVEERSIVEIGEEIIGYLKRDEARELSS